MKYVFLFLLFLFVVPFAFSAYPSSVGYVNDFAKVLSAKDSQKLNQKLVAFKRQTTNEVTVVTINSLGEQSIEDYSIGLADQWKPGVKGIDNGVILLFAINDHKDRIEVGRGLEGKLTDIQSQAILDDIRPDLRAGNYYGAFDKATNEVMDTISSSSSAKPVSSQNTDTGGTIGIIFILIVIGIFIFIMWALNRDTSESSDSSEDSSDDGFIGGAVAGGIAGSILGDSDSDDSDNSSSDSGSSDSSDDDGGGFSGGSFSGGGASSSW